MASSTAYAQILKDFYLPPLMAQLNAPFLNGLLDAVGGDEILAAALAADAERLTLLLAEGPRMVIPEELEDVGHILCFFDPLDCVWALPPDHPYSLNKSI